MDEVFWDEAEEVHNPLDRSEPSSSSGRPPGRSSASSGDGSVEDASDRRHEQHSNTYVHCQDDGEELCDDSSGPSDKSDSNSSRQSDNDGSHFSGRSNDGNSVSSEISLGFDDEVSEPESFSRAGSADEEPAVKSLTNRFGAVRISATGGRSPLCKAKSSTTVSAGRSRGPPDRGNVSFLKMYPKSMSLIGINVLTDNTAGTQQRPLSTKPCRPVLETRVLRRTSSLTGFTETIRDKLDRPRSVFDNAETRRLNRAVYEAWYFAKVGELSERRRREKQPRAGTRAKYRLFTPTVRRQPTHVHNRSDRVKMTIDATDTDAWKWLRPKLAELRRCRLRKQQDALKQQQELLKKKAEQQADASSAFMAWKAEKIAAIRERRRQENETKQQLRVEKEHSQREKREVAQKVFAVYTERVDRERSERARAWRRRQRGAHVQTLRSAAARDQQARWRYESWLQQRVLDHQPVEGAASTPRPWYPAGSQYSVQYRWMYEHMPGRPADSRLWRPPAVSGPPGSRPCRQPHCPLCARVAVTTLAVSTARVGVSVPLRQPVTCSSRRVVYLVQCTRCHRQLVGCCVYSMRRALAEQLADSRGAAGGSALARHLASHEDEQLDGDGDVERVLRRPDVTVIGLRSFPESASRLAVRDLAETMKDLFGTWEPDGLNLRRSSSSASGYEG